jgi:hypothetical protein
MKGKHFALLFLLVALAGSAGYFLYQDNTASWNAATGTAGGKVIEFPINDVARVTIKATGGELNLVKQGDEWTVQERAGYSAAFDQVSDLIRKLWELKTVQEVKVGPSQFPRLELVEPGKEGAAGTVVELKDKDGKKLAALLIGKSFLKKSAGMAGDSEGFPAGRYVVPLGRTNVSLVSETLDSVATKPEPWLKRDFFSIENVKSIKLAGQDESQRWTLTRENATAEWKLADAKPDETIDSAKVSSLPTVFSHARFADVLAPDAKPEDTGLDQPATATFETSDKFTYVLKIGKPNGENQPVSLTVSADLAKEREPGKDEKPEDKTKLDEEFKAARKRLEDKLAAEKKFERRAYLIAKTTIDQLLKDRAALLVEKKPEPAPAPANPEKPAPAPAPSAPTTVVPPPGTPPPPSPVSPDNTKPAPAPPAPTAPQPPSPPASSPPVTPPPPASPDKPTPASPTTPPPSVPPPAPASPDKANPEPPPPAPVTPPTSAPKPGSP